MSTLAKIPKTAIVVGGGLAGTSMAEALQRHGFIVTLIERHPQLAQEASGQSAAIAQPILHAEPTLKMRLSLAGFHYLKSHLQRLLQEGHKIRHSNCGVLQLAHKPQLQQRFAKSIACLPDKHLRVATLVNSQQASHYCGTTCKFGGVFFPQAFWLSPQDLCQAHVLRPRIRLLLGQSVLSFRYDSNALIEPWLVKDNKQNILACASHLILACAHQTKNFSTVSWLPLQSIRGQSFLLPASQATKSLQCVVTYDGHIIPSVDDNHSCLVGASFEPWNTQTQIDAAQNFSLYNKLVALLPQLQRESSPSFHAMTSIATNRMKDYLGQLPTRVAFRTASPDRMPLCGALNSKNLYLTTGYGSHGLVLAPLGAELIAAELAHEKPLVAIEPPLLAAMSPHRYLPK